MADGRLRPGALPVQGTEASSLNAKLEAAASHSEESLQAALRLGPVPGPRRDYALPASLRRVRRRWRGRYTRAVVAFDLVAAALSAVVTGLLLEPLHPAVALAYPLVVVAALTLTRAYEHRFIAQGDQEFRRIVAAGTALVALTATIALVTGGADIRGLALLALPLTAALCLAGHLGARLLLLAARRRARRGMQRCVVIGLERSVAEFIRTAREHPECGLEVVAACITRRRGNLVDGVPVLGAAHDALRALTRTRADTVILTAWSDVSQDELRLLSWDLEGSGVELLVCPRLVEVSAPRVHLRNVGGVPLLHVDEPEFSGLRRVAKTALDYGLTVPALVVLSPLMLMVALAVRLTSPGPVLFRQERVGRYGRPFTMHKFRSMYLATGADPAPANDHGAGPLFKNKQDPRVTPVGRIIRRFSLDELPQLLDVLGGSMSLVGPRPPLPGEVARYENGVRRRLLVRPGITGLWQVSGRSDLSWQESVRLDLSYVENWSLPLDVWIMARTVGAVMASRGAY